MSNGQIQFQLRSGRHEVTSVSYKELTFIIEAMEKRIEWYDEVIPQSSTDDDRAELGMDCMVMKDLCARLKNLHTRILGG